MADFDDAFVALQLLDEQGRKALRLSGAMWEEILREAITRAERAEYLMWLLHDWASDLGLTFDVTTAAAEWDATHQCRPPVLLPWFQTLQAARSAQLHEMRVRLRRSYDGQLRARLRTHRERDRADAAEAERDRLVEEIERLRAPRNPSDVPADAPAT